MIELSTTTKSNEIERIIQQLDPEYPIIVMRNGELVGILVNEYVSSTDEPYSY